MMQPKNINPSGMLSKLAEITIAGRKSWLLTGVFRVGLWKEKVLSWALMNLSVLWKLVGWVGSTKVQGCVTCSSLHSVSIPSFQCPILLFRHLLPRIQIDMLLPGYLTSFSTPVWNHPWEFPMLGNHHHNVPGVWILALLLRCRWWGTNTRAV